MIAADIGRAAIIGSIPLAAWFGALRIEQLYARRVFWPHPRPHVSSTSPISHLPTLIDKEQLIGSNSKLPPAGVGVAEFALVQVRRLAGASSSRRRARWPSMRCRFCSPRRRSPRIRTPEALPAAVDDRRSVPPEIVRACESAVAGSRAARDRRQPRGVFRGRRHVRRRHRAVRHARSRVLAGRAGPHLRHRRTDPSSCRRGRRELVPAAVGCGFGSDDRRPSFRQVSATCSSPVAPNATAIAVTPARRAANRSGPQLDGLRNQPDQPASSHCARRRARSMCWPPEHFAVCWRRRWSPPSSAGAVPTPPVRARCWRSAPAECLAAHWSSSLLPVRRGNATLP